MNVLDRLAAMVIKQGVGIGLLPEADRALALALVWRGLPADAVLSEREVNEVLKAQLAGPASFLDTDHVELRRWLVDAGWLGRDGFGHEYRPTAAAALPDAARALASALSIVEPAAWCGARRRDAADQREAKRQAWLARQAAASAETPGG